MTGRWRQAVRAENCGDLSLDNLVVRSYDRGGEPEVWSAFGGCAMTRLLLPGSKLGTRPTREYEATVA